MNDTHFGFETIASTEKTARVNAVFDSVARRYDVMNDLMSFGAHRLWKRFAVHICAVREGEHVLDLAGGTGDLSALFAKHVGSSGQVVLADINGEMLEAGRRKLVDRGIVENVRYMRVDAQALPFADESFDCVTIAFGLRNVTDKDAALAAMQRVLRPGGRCLVLEFSTPRVDAIRPLYDRYSFSVLPRLGKLIVDDAESYRYLAESIRMHPPQDELKAMMEGAGLERCTYHNLMAGIVAVHKGYKL